MSRLQPYTGLSKKDPDYYTKRRHMRLEIGLCEKCSKKVDRAGLCKKHYLALLVRTASYNPRKTGRKNRCRKCGERGHGSRTCDLRRSMGA